MNKTKLSIIGGAVTAVIGVSCMTSAMASDTRAYIHTDGSTAKIVIDPNGDCFGQSPNVDGNGMPTDSLCANTWVGWGDNTWNMFGFASIWTHNGAILTVKRPDAAPFLPTPVTSFNGPEPWRVGTQGGKMGAINGIVNRLVIGWNADPNTNPVTPIFVIVGNNGNLAMGDVTIGSSMGPDASQMMNKSLWITNNLPKTNGPDVGDNNYIRLLPCAGISAGNSNCESVKTTLNGAIDNDYFLPAGSPTPTKPDASGITKEVLPYSSCNKNYNNKTDSPKFNNVDQYNSNLTCKQGTTPCLINTLVNPNQNSCANAGACAPHTLTYYNRFRNAWAIAGPQQSQAIFPFLDQRADAIQWGAKYPIPNAGQDDYKQMGSRESDGNACYLYAYLGGRVGYDMPDNNGSSQRLGYLVFKNGKLSMNSLLSVKAHLAAYNTHEATVDGVKNGENPHFDVRYESHTGTLIFNKNSIGFLPPQTAAVK